LKLFDYVRDSYCWLIYRVRQSHIELIAKEPMKKCGQHIGVGGLGEQIGFILSWQISLLVDNVLSCITGIGYSGISY